MIFKIYRIFILFLLNFCLAETCDNILNLAGEYKLNLSELTQGKSEVQAYAMQEGTLMALGEDVNSNFIDNSFLTLGGNKYRAKSCSKDTLLVRNDRDEEHSFKIDRIISYPQVYDPKQIKTINSDCNKLANIGNYKVTLEDNNSRVFTTDFRVMALNYLTYHFADLNTEVVYSGATLKDGDKFLDIFDCKDYIRQHSRLQNIKEYTSYRILKIEQMPTPPPYLLSPCRLLSIKGKYLLEKKDKEGNQQYLGKLTLTVNPYELEYFFNNSGKRSNEFKFKLLYRPHGGFPELLLPNGKEDKIESCIENIDGTNVLRFSERKEHYLEFTSVVVEKQDLDYLFKAKEILDEDIKTNYTLSKPIYHDLEIMMRLLDIPSRSSTEFPQFCRKLIFPGRYKIYYKNKKQNGGYFIFNDMFFDRVYKQFDKKRNIAYYEFRGVKEDEHGKSLKVFSCKDLVNSSVFTPGSGKAVDKNFKEQKTILKIDTIALTPESESWLSEDIYKIRLRTNSLCPLLIPNTNYKISGPYGEMSMFVGGIHGKGFNFKDGYTVFFNYYQTFINGGDRGYIDQRLDKCFSSIDGNFLILNGYETFLKEKGKFLNKSKRKQIAIKFETLGRVKNRSY